MSDSVVGMASSPGAETPKDAVNSVSTRSRTQERKMEYSKRLRIISREVMNEMTTPTRVNPQHPVVRSKLSFDTEATTSTDQSIDLPAGLSIPKSHSPRSPIDLFPGSVETTKSPNKMPEIRNNDTPWLKETAIGRTSSRHNEETKSVLDSILDRINCNVCSLAGMRLEDEDPYVSSKGPMIDKQFKLPADNDDLTAATRSVTKSLQDTIEPSNTRDANDTVFSDMSMGTDGSLWTRETGVMTEGASLDEITVRRNLNELKQIENAVEKLREYSMKHNIPIKDLLAGYEQDGEDYDDYDLNSLYDKGFGRLTNGMVRSLLACGVLVTNATDMIPCGPGQSLAGEQISGNESSRGTTPADEESFDGGIEILGERNAVVLVAGSVDRNNLHAPSTTPTVTEHRKEMATKPGSCVDEGGSRIVGETVKAEDCSTSAIEVELETKASF